MAAVVCGCVLAVMQLACVMFVRNTLRDCASEAARYAALENRGLDDGRARARTLLAQSLPSSFSGDITAQATTWHGAEVVEVTIQARMPALALIGSPVMFRAVGHGIKDAQ